MYFCFQLANLVRKIAVLRRSRCFKYPKKWTAILRLIYFILITRNKKCQMLNRLFTVHKYVLYTLKSKCVYTTLMLVLSLWASLKEYYFPALLWCYKETSSSFFVGYKQNITRSYFIKKTIRLKCKINESREGLIKIIASVVNRK